MGEWKTYRLGEITSYISRGITPSYCDTGLTIINQKCIRNGVVDFSLVKYTDPQKKIPSDKILQDRDILINSTGTGTLGRVSIYHQIGQQCTVDSHVTIVRSSKNIDATFLGYSLINQQHNIESLATGSTGQTELPRARLASEIEILLPPLDEQQRIAGILGSLDDKIELNRRINANLEAQAQALFRSWFVDFEPFRDGPFVDSELGKIPQGWKVGTINEIIQILSGYAFKSDTFTEAGPYRLITIKNVQDGSLNIDGAAYLSEIPDKMPQHCHLAIGDILLSLTGNVGRVCIVDRDGLLLNQRVAKLQPKDKRNTFFTYALFRQDSFKQYLIQITKGTAQLNLSPVETSDTKIVLPNQDILLQFGEIGQPLFDNIVSNCKEIITLSALRDTLLPKLIAGEIAIE